jgi:hypothetical protein
MYRLRFKRAYYDDLDQFGCQASDSRNLGNNGDWQLAFRHALYGLQARLLGVEIHYRQIHSRSEDREREVHPLDWEEYQISSILFNMASSIECTAFALNALGYGANPEKFRDVTNKEALRKVSYGDILKTLETVKRPKDYVPGYDVYFPMLKGYWLSSRRLIGDIFEWHNASKHRSSIRASSIPRAPSFPETGDKTAVTDYIAQQLTSPLAEVYLLPQPMVPWSDRHPNALEPLESMTQEFCQFINVCSKRALEDAKCNIKLTW